MTRCTVFHLALPIGLGTAVAIADPPGEASMVPAGSRVIHRFDFDERREGNVEDLPRYWVPLESGSSFPGFANGTFDFETGHTAPPSFRLSSSGRNTVYLYAGPETRVRPRSEYRIEAFLRPDRLVHARACLAAFFVDGEGRPMLETLTRSRYLGGPSDGDDWVRLELLLPAAPPNASTVGLAAWVLQESAWNPAGATRRPIARVDVYGGLWLDDITLVAVPKVDIRTGSPGNVLSPESPQAIEAVISDFEEGTLQGRLRITAADGTTVDERGIESGAGPFHLAVDSYPPGLYSAVLTVSSSGGQAASRSIDFVRLAPKIRTAAVSRAFGIVLDSNVREWIGSEPALVLGQGVNSVKIPMNPGPAGSSRALDRMLQDLGKRGMALTAVLSGPAADERSSATSWPESPDGWPSYASSVAAPYATVFRAWQLGADSSTLRADPQQLGRSAARLREAMTRFVTAPVLAVPLSSAWAPPTEPLAVEQVTIGLGTELDEQGIEDVIRQYRAKGHAGVSAYVEPLDVQPYRRLPRLADFARRVVTARFAGADVVYVPQTWRVDAGLQAAEPTEEYVILRTLADVLGELPPGSRWNLAPGVSCLSFGEGARCTLALWDMHAPSQGRTHAMQLGSASRLIDLWGQTTPLERDTNGQHRILLSSLPVFVDGVDRRLLAFRESVALEPAHVESGLEVVAHRLVLTGDAEQALGGEVQWNVPASWEISPRRLAFNLRPQEKGEFPVEIRYPPGEPAGRKPVSAIIRLHSPAAYLEVPIALEVGPSDFEVSGSAIIEGRDLMLRQRITNRTNEPLYLRSSAQVPGYERQYRPVNDLRPGETQQVEYRFAAAAHLVGTTVRLSLHSFQDNRRAHHLDLLVR